jgi:hypothetical protein
MNWSILKEAVALTAPVLSFGFFIMGIIRYFWHETAGRGRHLAGAAFVSYGLYLLSIASFVLLGRVLLSEGNAIFLIGTSAGAWSAAGLSALLGFLSRLPSGRRVAIAGILILVALLAGAFALISSLAFGNIVT